MPVLAFLPCAGVADEIKQRHTLSDRDDAEPDGPDEDHHDGNRRSDVPALDESEDGDWYAECDEGQGERARRVR